MNYLNIILPIMSHIVAALYIQKLKYNKLVTACFWGAYAIVSLCIMLLEKNVICGFFCMLLMQAIVFYITSEGPASEKNFLFLTYANSFCICIGANLILSFLLKDSAYLAVCLTGIVILMHIFLYKILLPVYRKSKTFFYTGWWKLNIILVFFLLQFLNQYAFTIIDKNNASDFAFDFVIFSIIFYSTLILIFDSVRDTAEMNKKIYEYDKLKNIAYIDVLTNMQNRAAYAKFVKKQVSNHGSDNDSRFIFVMLDIDGFKNINDTKGHAKGDEILKCVGGIITEHFKTFKCESFRIGGDEFVLLLEHMQLSDVEEELKILNKKIFELNNVELSYGCSEVDFNNENPFEAAFKKADVIMYSNKQQKHILN